MPETIKAWCNTHGVYDLCPSFPMAEEASMTIIDSVTANRNLNTDLPVGNIRLVREQYRAYGYRFTYTTHTWDGRDRTWQTSGAGNERFDTLNEATRTIERLRQTIVAFDHQDLTWQDLLDTTIQVEVWDEQERRTTTYTYVPVIVPYKVTLDGKEYQNNGSAYGFQAVLLNESVSLEPRNQQ